MYGLLIAGGVIILYLIVVHFITRADAKGEKSLSEWYNHEDRIWNQHKKWTDDG